MGLSWLIWNDNKCLSCSQSAALKVWPSGSKLIPKLRWSVVIVPRFIAKGLTKGHQMRSRLLTVGIYSRT